MPNTTKNRSSGVEDVLKPDEPAAKQPSPRVRNRRREEPKRASPIREANKKNKLQKHSQKTLFWSGDSAMIAL
jgi:hypothetical protein